jgi:hypothetical protein
MIDVSGSVSASQRAPTGAGSRVPCMAKRARQHARGVIARRENPLEFVQTAT